MFPGAHLVLASICSDNDLAPHRQQAIMGINYALIYWHIYASLDHNSWVPAGCQTISWTNADFSPQDLSSITPIMSMDWIQTYAFLSNIMISANRFVAIE